MAETNKIYLDKIKIIDEAGNAVGQDDYRFSIGTLREDDNENIVYGPENNAITLIQYNKEDKTYILMINGIPLEEYIESNEKFLNEVKLSDDEKKLIFTWNIDIDGEEGPKTQKTEVDITTLLETRSYIIEDPEETDDVEAIKNNAASPIVGDIAIVIRTLVSDKKTRTAYVYNSEKEWEALDGNYSAENVYLKNNITLAGNFASVGNYEKGKTTIAAGTSIEALLSGMLQQELEPQQETLPAATISVSGGSGEVGTSFSAPTATLKIDDVGSYTYGPATGITFAIGDVKLAEGEDPTTATNSITNDFVMKQGNTISLKADKGGTYSDTATTYKFSGTAFYTVPATGSVPVTNLGNERLDVKFIDDSVAIENKTVYFIGYRKWFYGGDTSTDFNSATIRKLSDLEERKNVTFELKAASYDGCSRIVIAIPTAAKKKVSSVLLKSSSNADITGEFKKINTAETLITVEGANGATSVTYDVWEYKPASLDSTEVYTITIANA